MIKLVDTWKEGARIFSWTEILRLSKKKCQEKAYIIAIIIWTNESEDNCILGKLQ